MQSDFHTHHSNWNCSKVTNTYLLQNLHFSQLLYNSRYQWSLLNSPLATSIKISPIFPNLFGPLSVGFPSTTCTLMLALSAHAFSSWSTTSSYTISSISNNTSHYLHGISKSSFLLPTPQLNFQMLSGPFYLHIPYYFRFSMSKFNLSSLGPSLKVLFFWNSWAGW